MVLDLHDVFLFLFFFQAEDGIRDLVRSRGLGDVYKRQRPARVETKVPAPAQRRGRPRRDEVRVPAKASPVPVSYTHLTLPTSDLV